MLKNSLSKCRVPSEGDLKRHGSLKPVQVMLNIIPGPHNLYPRICDGCMSILHVLNILTYSATMEDDIPVRTRPNTKDVRKRPCK